MPWCFVFSLLRLCFFHPFCLRPFFSVRVPRPGLKWHGTVCSRNDAIRVLHMDMPYPCIGTRASTPPRRAHLPRAVCVDPRIASCPAYLPARSARVSHRNTRIASTTWRWRGQGGSGRKGRGAFPEDVWRRFWAPRALLVIARPPRTAMGSGEAAVAWPSAVSGPPMVSPTSSGAWY